MTPGLLLIGLAKHLKVNLIVFFHAQDKSGLGVQKVDQVLAPTDFWSVNIAELAAPLFLLWTWCGHLIRDDD